jgi:S-methyl-5-thioribose-1-phosphate isomerase
MIVTLHGRRQHFRSVTFATARNAVHLIDQRLLPHEFKVVALADYRATALAIREMVVRGAPAIAATAAYGLAQGARDFRGRSLRQFARHVRRVYEALKHARPTAVDPVNAMDEVLTRMSAGETVPEQQALAVAAAEDFAYASVAQCEAIGRHGAKLIRQGLNVLTHCNAGWLACVDVGTATAPLYAAHARGRRFHVFCDETRPRCQGATLTAWELAQQGISHQVIADNAAGLLFARGDLGLVIVGSDRVVARTGEIANKIGTYTKAVLAHRHRVPFYVAVPLSTLDWELQSGREIAIEHRDEREVLGAWGVVESSKLKAQSSRGRGQKGRREPVYVRIANPTSGAWNPGFDVTPPELITGIITPAGIFKPKDLWRHRRLLGGPALRA